MIATTAASDKNMGRQSGLLTSMTGFLDSLILKLLVYSVILVKNNPDDNHLSFALLNCHNINDE